MPRPLVVAHRGGALLAPENTRAACARALRLGVDAVEVDVRLTADGVPVCLHDATLERTTNGRGPLAATPAAVVQRLDATARWPGRRRFAPEPPPALADVLDLLQGHALALVEIKAESTWARTAACTRAVVALVAERRLREGCVLLSFDWRALALARHQLRGVATQPLAAGPLRGDTCARLASEGVASVGMAYRAITASALAAARRAGLTVNAWTPNRRPSWERLLRLGVSAITTDRPDALLAVLASSRNCA